MEATRKTEVVTVGVTLELTAFEASVLKLVCGSVGGLGKHKDVATKVYDVLTQVGVDTVKDGYTLKSEYGGLYLNEQEKDDIPF